MSPSALYTPSMTISARRCRERTSASSRSAAAKSLCGKVSRWAPENSAPCIALLWSSSSHSTTSPAPTRCAMVETFVVTPPMKRMQSSTPMKLAISCSSSWCIGRSPDTTPAGRHRRSVAAHRLDGGRVDARVARKAEVVVVGEVEHLAARDLRGAAARALVHAEIRVLESVALEILQTRLQQPVLGKLRCRQRRNEPFLAPRGQAVLQHARRNPLPASLQRFRERPDGRFAPDEGHVHAMAQHLFQLGDETHRGDRIEPVLPHRRGGVHRPDVDLELVRHPAAQPGLHRGAFVRQLAERQRDDRRSAASVAR